MEERTTNPTEQKLFRAFMQFKKAGWHQRSIEGCTPSEIRVMFCIKRGVKPDAHEMKVSEISKHLHVTAPTITQLLKGLEAQGLIERRVDPTDRRAVGIQLTQKGERVTQKAEEAFFATFHGLIEYLGEEQSNQLAELLSQVSRYFEEKAASVQYPSLNGNEEA
ncbi:MAG TPA: MarR family transcriptional regulator [Ktedonobacteraceae bacterium]|jgi:DNA-binding MarR family transcriptional regulator|nr:MarR family transcriptional regulator [Ktedonobacteraceae bacterium]